MLTKFTLAAILLTAGPSLVQAARIRFNLANVQLPGGVISGSFVYDPAASAFAMSDVNISTFLFTPLSNGTASFNSITFQYDGPTPSTSSTLYFTPVPFGAASVPVLIIDLLTPITTAFETPGTASTVNPLFLGFCSSPSCTSGEGYERKFTYTGQIVSAGLADTPEPTTGLLLLSAAIACGFVARARKN